MAMNSCALDTKNQPLNMQTLPIQDNTPVPWKKLSPYPWGVWLQRPSEPPEKHWMMWWWGTDKHLIYILTQRGSYM